MPVEPSGSFTLSPSASAERETAWRILVRQAHRGCGIRSPVSTACADNAAKGGLGRAVHRLVVRGLGRSLGLLERAGSDEECGPLGRRLRIWQQLGL